MSDLTPDDMAHLKAIEDELDIHLEEWAKWNSDRGLTTLSCLLLRKALEFMIDVHGADNTEEIMNELLSAITEEE